MRRSPALLLCSILAAFASAAAAQQVPQSGCNAGVNCQPRGFSVLTGLDKQHVGPAFGIRFGPGFEFYIPGLESVTKTKAPSDGQFHLQLPPARKLFPETDFKLPAPPPAAPAKVTSDE
jgi:hypothetical protein